MNDGSFMPDISVVILCYKAKELVPVVVSDMKKALDSRGISYELVLVANYNAHEIETDHTHRIARDLAAEDSHITVVARSKEGMMGWDLRTGLDIARGKAVAFIDGDGQMPVEDVVRVYDALVSGPYDIAKTYRTTRMDGLKRRVVSKIYNTLLKTLFPKVKVKDANSKPKVFTYDALRKLELNSTDWFIDAEIIIEASRLGLRITEVPTVFHQNAHRKSFIKNSAIFEFMLNLLRHRFRSTANNA